MWYPDFIRSLDPEAGITCVNQTTLKGSADPSATESEQTLCLSRPNSLSKVPLIGLRTCLILELLG